jgi:hypothetical protein
MYQGLDPIVLCPLVNEINSFSFSYFGIEAAFYLFIYLLLFILGLISGHKIKTMKLPFSFHPKPIIHCDRIKFQLSS